MKNIHIVSKPIQHNSVMGVNGIRLEGMITTSARGADAADHAKDSKSTGVGNQ